jgi:hypothetical protein
MRYDHYKQSKGEGILEHEDAVLVSRSGRPSDHKIEPEDLVHVVSFDRVRSTQSPP